MALSDRAASTDERLAQLRGPELCDRMGPTDLWIGTGVSGGVARAGRFGHPAQEPVHLGVLAG